MRPGKESITTHNTVNARIKISMNYLLSHHQWYCTRKITRTRHHLCHTWQWKTRKAPCWAHTKISSVWTLYRCWWFYWSHYRVSTTSSRIFPTFRWRMALSTLQKSITTLEEDEEGYEIPSGELNKVDRKRIKTSSTMKEIFRRRSLLICKWLMKKIELTK